MQRPEQWSLLRTKTDETVDDDDWAGTPSTPSAAICAPMPSCVGQHGRPYTGIEVFALGVDASGVPQARSTMTVDLTLIEIVSRDLPGLSGTVAAAVAIVDSAVSEDVPLQRVVYFPLNGASLFTIRVTGDTNDAVDNLQIWWRAVSR